METQDIQPDEVAGEPEFEPLSKRTRTQYALAGLLVGFLSYLFLGFIFFYFGMWLFENSRRNLGGPNGYMLGLVFIPVFCLIPSLIGSTLGGWGGGTIGYKKGVGRLGAILGGLLSTIIVFSFWFLQYLFDAGFIDIR